MTGQFQTGLAGVKAGQTAISTVEAEGSDLFYRGYSINDLAGQGSFEEVAYLLIYGILPSRTKLRNYKAALCDQRVLPGELKDVLELLPANSHPMDVLRAGCSVLGCIEPESESNTAQLIADRLLGCLGSMLLYWHHYHSSGRRIDTQSDDLTIAGHFLHLLREKPVEEPLRRALDVSLILYAEHEFNASTFASRIVASTHSDFYSVIVAAIGALRGPLHGGANEAAIRLVLDYGSPDEAEQGVRHMLHQKQLIMGFGHRVYRAGDPRSPIIKAWARSLARSPKQQRILDISQRIEQVMQAEKGIFPNLDFYSASVYHFCGIPIQYFTPLFVVSRICGWAAHIIEQRQHNKLIRPLADYNGPRPLSYIPMERRD